MKRSKKFIVEYRSDNGSPAKLICSEIHGDGGDAVTALSASDRARKRLLRKGIVAVADFDTGEIVDIDRCLVPISILSAVEVEKIRQRDKWEWDKKYQMRVIENHYRNKLFALFEFRCFKCSRPGTLRTDYEWMGHVPFWRGLDRDHHVPINLGGRLVPGNIGVLCKSCNSKKHEADPKDFYTAPELTRLQRYLDKQVDILSFTFDRDAWREDPSAYLISLGIDEQLVTKVLNNENHRYFQPPSSPIGISLTVDMDAVLRGIEASGPPEREDE